MNYSWHPSCGDIQFIQATTALYNFIMHLSSNTADYVRDYISEDKQIRELVISNIYHPLHHGEYYGWISMVNKNNWWIADKDLIILKKYGWSFCVNGTNI